MLYNEPGVFLAFEETAEELAQNVRSLGFDLDDLIEKKKLAVDYIHIERSEIEETGEYDLEGLFIRLGHAIDSIGAKRVVLDTLETLFSGLNNVSILRAELRRLFRSGQFGHGEVDRVWRLSAWRAFERPVYAGLAWQLTWASAQPQPAASW